MTPDPITKFDVVGVGENSVDYVYRLPDALAPNAKLSISSRTVGPGGQVATAMCACAALGLRAKYIGAFGSDDNGALIRDALAGRGVDIGDAPVRPCANRYAVILVNQRTGDRTVLWQRDVALSLRPHELAPERLAGARLLHLDDVDEEASIAAARIARAAGIPVTSDLDRVTERTAELVNAVTIPIFAEHALQALTRESDPEQGLRRLRAQHDGLLCVTLGSHGALLLDGERLHRANPLRVQAVDTTAAGDVFRGAFIYALLRGDSPPDILRFANAAAAVSCTREGAIDSVPTLADIEARLRADR